MRLGLDAQNLNAKECHFILPLVCGPLLCSPSLLLLPQQDHTKLIFSALISHAYLESIFLLLALMTTYLKDLTQSIGWYSELSWQNWFKGCLDAQVVSLLGANDLTSIRGKSSSTCWRIHANITSIRI